MTNLFKLGITLAAVFILSACVADRNDKRLVNPMEKMSSIYDNGSIFKPGFNERPLFEEKRARNVGDGLIMNIAEIPAAKKPDKKEKKEDAESTDGEERQRTRKDTVDEDLSNVASDALVGTITLTVMEVMDNGHLFVAGGKQVSAAEGDKYVRITGIVDPNNITGGNIVQSTQVSEVRLQLDDVRIYADRTATRVSEGQSIFGGLFQSMRHE
jgi:flagellar L-ring protein FlgH